MFCAGCAETGQKAITECPSCCLPLEATRKALNRPELKIVENLAFGHEAEEILKASQRMRAGLVVMGSRGITGLRRILLGSVSHKVVRYAQCSVLVVRQ